VIEWLELIKPFLSLRGKVSIHNVEVEVVDYYVIIYVETSSDDEAELLADAIDQVKEKIKEVTK